MQRRVLNYLYDHGGLTFFAFPDEKTPYEAVERFALAQNAGARFIVIDFTAKNDGNINITTNELFKTTLTEDDIKNFEEQNLKGWIFGGFTKPDDSEKAFRIFYHNLELLKKYVPHIVGILPNDEPKPCNNYIFRIAKLVIIAGNNLKANSVYIEDSPELQNTPLLWLPSVPPNKKIYPKAHKAYKKSFSRVREFKKNSWIDNTDKFVQNLSLLYKVEILKKNPLDGMSKIFVNSFLLFFIIALLLPFVIPTKIDTIISNMRDRFSERDKLSVAPSFEYTFDGNEPLQRIARYAIGRFNATVTNEKMVQRYIDETMEENELSYKGWEKNNLIYPPATTVIKFSRPENLKKSSSETIGAAWKYWTSIVSDSIAYITEFYHAEATSTQRQHNGIDLASRQGARILAPFAAKAWTSKDERGGTIIALVREKDVILFMHCDQLLYLDGQDVMPGDPIATVGLTGHTTGPHAHIVTGLVSKNGNKQIGNVFYKVINPIDWFYKFKPNTSR